MADTFPDTLPDTRPDTRQDTRPATHPAPFQAELLSAETAAQQLARLVAPNGLRYATLGRLAATHTSPEAIARLVGTVPATLAASLQGTTYAFVPLALSGARLTGNSAVEAAFQTSDSTLIATTATPELVDKAICHRNSTVDGADLVFLSAELHNDSFALAFEFFINVAHDLVDIAGMPASFGELLQQQVTSGVRGETSIDASEHRTAAFGAMPDDSRPASRPRPAAPITPADRERAQKEYHHAAFADSVAIYLLSLFLDFDYADLREREYPLLTPPALAARLRVVHALYPPNDGYSFQVLYRRRP